MMFERFKGCKIGILGFGREGRSTYSHLKNVAGQIVIIDRSKSGFDSLEDKDVDFLYEKDLNKNIQFDYVFKSPGVPLKNIVDKIDMQVITSQTNEFLRQKRDNIIGITGTKGKSTTAYMIYKLLKGYGADVQIVGNIGIPPFDVGNSDYYVFEMSSHQLEHVNFSPKVAILLNIFEEHLDHYMDFSHYKMAKENIFRFALSDDRLYTYNGLNADSKAKVIIIDELLKGTIFGIKGEGLDLNDFKNITGLHNKKNAAVAIKVVKDLGYYDKSIITKVLKDFKGLKHRLEFVANKDGIDFYDDSISTIPASLIAGVEAIDNVQTVLVGGMDRGIDYSEVEEFVKLKADINFILMPDTGHDIGKRVRTDNIFFVDDLKQAVKKAKEITQSGKAVLLSPAAASYGFFKNFEERGDKYKEYVFSD